MPGSGFRRGEGDVGFAPRVVADLDARKLRNPLLQQGVLRLDHLGGERAPSDVGLIGGDDEHEAGGGEGAASRGNVGEKLKRRHGARWLGQTMDDHRNVERAIAVEKHGGPQR
jgi:hypothetical protein